jgi:hypothetical protein
LSLESCERGSYACLKDANVKRINSCLGDTSVDDEVHGVLNWDIQSCNDTRRELSKEEMTVKNDNGFEYHWYMIMEESLQKGIKCLQ